MTRHPNATGLAIGGVCGGLGLALYDALVMGLRAQVSPGTLVPALAGSVALLVPPTTVALAILGVLLDRALAGRSALAMGLELWRDAPGPRAARVVGGLATAAVYLLFARTGLMLADESVRSSRFRALAAVLLGLGAWGVGALVGGSLARWSSLTRLRPRTPLTLGALASVGTVLGVLVVRRDLVEALGVDFFAAPLVAGVGVVGGLAAGGRARKPVLIVALASVLLGALALGASDVRETLAFESVSARRLLALGPRPAASPAGDSQQAPPWFQLGAHGLARPRPVVLISLDAVSARHLGSYGYERATSPQLDAWARGAVVFEAAMAQGPVTRLSVPSLFTSLYPSQVAMTRRNGVSDEQRLADDTLAERLARAGYDTVAVPGGRYFVGFRGMMQGVARVNREAARRTAEIETRAAIVTEQALAELDRLGTSARPAFLWVHYDDAHAPHSSVVGAPSFGDRQIDRYDQEIWHIDRHLGRLFEAIDRVLGERAPLVIVTADHGERFDGSGRALDRSEVLLDMTLHVPLMIKVAGVPAGRRPSPVGLVDLLPTVLDLTGIPARARFEGRSLVPELQGKRADRSRTVFAELDQAGMQVLDAVAARRGDTLLIVDRLRGVRRAYDLAHDPRTERPLRTIPRDIAGDVDRFTRRMLRSFQTRAKAP